MQNTIVKEFEDNPNVVTAVFEQGGSHGETGDWVQIYWNNYYLRGGLLWDATGAVAGNIYGQPNTHLPFGRGFIIDQDGFVALPYFGHQPQMAIAKIYELLGGTDAVVPAPAARLSAWPNPFNPKVTIEYALPDHVDSKLAIHDLKGRRLRSFTLRGSGSLIWDGRDSKGREVPSGVYFARLGETAQPLKLVLLR
jgi:hypothetical protein